MWNITTSDGRTTNVDRLISEYGEDLYAADESGFDVDVEEMRDEPEKVADAGYGPRDTRRILFWANEADSDNDPGQRSVAEARWEEE